jgi:hypothetical protein
MANLKFFTSASDYSTLYSARGTLISGTATDLTVTGDNQGTTLYQGNFTFMPEPIYAHGSIVGSIAGVHGTISSFEYYSGSTLAATGSGFFIDASSIEAEQVYKDTFSLYPIQPNSLAGNDSITGSPGADPLRGYFSGADVLRGYGGNDFIFGAGGDDSIDGGYGNNTAGFTGVSSEYTITPVGNAAIRVTDSVAGRDGSDLLTHIDQLQFANQTAASGLPPEHLNPVYRFFDTHTGDHFYTTSADEKAQIQQTLPWYNYEGAAWATPDKSADTTDVFRFYDTATNQHFFTTSVAERDQVIKTLPSYHYEGVAFEAYANPDAVGSGAVTLERFFNTQTGQHHFAGNAEEAAGINQGAAGRGWIDEGKAFTVHVPTDGMLLL